MQGVRRTRTADKHLKSADFSNVEKFPQMTAAEYRLEVEGFRE
jgi:polyisoprenoid-binding protein YceI